MTFTVYGDPAPQGSKSFKGVRNGKAIMIESSKKVKPWRTAVEQEVLAKFPVSMRKDKILIRGPIYMSVEFYFNPPKSVRSGDQPCKRMDLDKLLRSTCDALTTAGVWEDDSRLVYVVARKKYTTGPELPGAMIYVSPSQYGTKQDLNRYGG